MKKLNFESLNKLNDKEINIFSELENLLSKDEKMTLIIHITVSNSLHSNTFFIYRNSRFYADLKSLKRICNCYKINYNKSLIMYINSNKISLLVRCYQLITEKLKLDINEYIC